MSSRDELRQYQSQTMQQQMQEIVAALSVEVAGKPRTLLCPQTISTGPESTRMATIEISERSTKTKKNSQPSMDSTGTLTAGNPARSTNTTIAILPNNDSTRSIPGWDFTCFWRLPPELRLIIWEHAAKAKRTITIRHNQPRGPWTRLKAAHNAEIVPRILHVCKEARIVGLKFYKLSLSAIFYLKPIYINYDHDALYFPTCKDLETLYAMGESRRPRCKEELAGLEKDLRIMIVGGCDTDCDMVLSPLPGRFWRLNSFLMPKHMSGSRLWRLGMKSIKDEWKEHSKAENCGCKIPKTKWMSRSMLAALGD
ncbi:hypothetical protein L207DRAFT_527107 [Hyaloscypha variabilis F]|uniref:2EXR domain-containing protein n=1 Tax=Hyaloscypha variabilis (strain UAMH 11265 / GT02V1 / F) TaxID=1149755 RepID=A0A2J6RUM4_HYAVF|nr:hypothetical protein L207DRAFT_527107 [Hyaloscypha variabilis F]